MMNSIELDAYFTHIGLPDTGRRLVEKARRTAPVRKVQSRLGNVLTRFPSRKMQRIVVAESRTVEFPPFIRKADKQWNCPQVEAHLHEYRIRYRLRTADEHPHTLVQNLLFLADYYAPEASSVDVKALARIRECLEEHGAITLADAIEFGKAADSPGGMPDGRDAPVREIATDTGFTADDIYKAIADGLVTYDLSAEPLSDSFRSRVYRDQSTLEFSRRLDTEVVDDDQQQIGADRIGSIQPGAQPSPSILPL